MYLCVRETAEIKGKLIGLKESKLLEMYIQGMYSYCYGAGAQGNLCTVTTSDLLCVPI
jgi:hypothetical protein